MVIFHPNFPKSNLDTPSGSISSDGTAVKTHSQDSKENRRHVFLFFFVPMESKHDTEIRLRTSIWTLILMILNRYRAAALTSQNHMTNYFRKAKEHGVQWQLNRSYCLTCTPGHVAAQFNWHGNCATVTVDTVVLGKCQAACVSKITVELTTFLPCSLMSETE